MESLLERLKRKEKYRLPGATKGEMRTAEPGILNRLTNYLSSAFPDTKEGVAKARYLTQGAYDTASRLPVIGQALGAKEAGAQGAREFLSRGYKVPWDTIKETATGSILGKAMFLGPKARGFNKARAMKGPGGHSWNEISDLPSRYVPLKTMSELGGVHKLGEALPHPELYKNYPQLKDINVAVTPLHEGGTYLPGGKDHPPLIVMGHKEKIPHDIMLHEVQHAIQDIENAPKGAGYNPTGIGKQDKEAFDKYWRSAGEVQARNVEERMDMNQTELNRTHPELTQDVPTINQIIEYWRKQKKKPTL